MVPMNELHVIQIWTVFGLLLFCILLVIHLLRFNPVQIYHNVVVFLKGTNMGTGKEIPGLEFIPGWMRAGLLHSLLGSLSPLKHRHSLGWVQASVP